jgi:DNA-binding NtrC family response regulator
MVTQVKREHCLEGDALEAESRSLGKVREEAEREHIASVLRLTGGNRARAARILKIKTLWKKLKRLGIHWPPGDTTHEGRVRTLG